LNNYRIDFHTPLRMGNFATSGKMDELENIWCLVTGLKGYVILTPCIKASIQTPGCF